MYVWENLLNTLNTAVMVIGLLAVVFGVVLWRTAWKKRKAASAKSKNARARSRRIPLDWSLDARPLVNDQEQQVWQWLLATFPECLVLPKLPVTRFTALLSHHNIQHWFGTIGDMYCTFTLCNVKGHVIGCVDVTNPQHFSRNSLQFKQQLLAQCDMAYWVVTPQSLPGREAIRAEFLGDAATQAFYEVARPAIPDSRNRKPADAHAQESVPSRTQPVPLMESATTPVSLPAESDFQETKDQLHEMLLERRRSRRYYDRAAANDNPPSRSSGKLEPARAADRATPVQARPFPLFFENGNNQDAMMALLSATG